MSEEKFEALMKLIEAKFDLMIAVDHGRDSTTEFLRYFELEQEFMFKFIQDN